MGQYSIAEANQILISSFLKKKAYVSTKESSVKSKQSYSYAGGPPTHAHWWWPSSDHIYWCVLRKGQFSYYKTKDEREAVDVLPRFRILSFRVIRERRVLNLYTRDKTLSFRAESTDLLEKWIDALDEFFDFKRNCRNKEIERMDSDGSSEDELDAVAFDTAFGLPTVRRDPRIEEAKIADFQNGRENDAEFYKLYDPRNAEHPVRSGELYARVKTRFNRPRWKKFRASLTNKSFKLYSVKTGKLRKDLSLDKLVDCVEIENALLDTLFALILTDERLKFCSRDDDQVIDWIITFKCGVLARHKIYGGVKGNSG